MQAQVHSESEFFSWLEELLTGEGYELVSLNLVNAREKKLQLFIDLAVDIGNRKVNIDDCVKVTHFLDVPLEKCEWLQTIFKTGYELEVSSPGIDRPLYKPKDFNRFSGERARIHTLRPLNGEEGSNTEYFLKNPKQKNFFGILKGFDQNRVLFSLIPDDGRKTFSKETPVTIPYALIAKANLEGEIEILKENENESNRA